MRKILLAFITLMILPAVAYAGTITASVNGLVCAFCATSIEKTFMKQSAVDSVKVDLEAKTVTIVTKEGQNIDDEAIAKLITDAGYVVTDIKREDRHASAQ